MSLRDTIISQLVQAKISSPRLECDILLRQYMPNYPQYTKEENINLNNAINRRINHEPLDKILGYKEFYKYTFQVDNNVLSPRPDTEILLEKALSFIDDDANSSVLDLGTGSGCILLSILKEKIKAQGVGVDISIDALQFAKKNAQHLKVQERVEFINKSWEEKDFVNTQFDIIVSNPPYIPTNEIETLDIEVKKYDPITALEGGVDGLKCYRDIAKITPLILKTGGYILLEVGYNQATDVANIFEKEGLKIVEIVQDLSGINRCVILKK
ncbi:MAG: peptide chain release factor N(5)-glutamine methyltransferase [Alphaproteobacteria bacterium]|nr:peptide chain release factor N(5)-glutamine methyltransferase [Alphaproteobacteria bacterium]